MVKAKDERININFSFDRFLLKHRLCSMKPPWREQLGCRVGNLFNRVSTYTPPKEEIKSWTKIYKEGSSELPVKIE